MSRVWMVRRASMRPGRVGFFLGLVLLIAAHLAGAVHASSFTGPHVAVETAAVPRPPAETGHDHEPAPEHRHSSGGHIDHAADRPRTTAGEAVTESDQAEPAAGSSGSADGALMLAVRCRRSDTAVPTSDSPRILALHCVWRL
ncbi:hypothetical protein [Streptomyces olivochromogenes]|uniref:hypothetical protein n=1 Tax=Streptomyces olivochromogenes TaxID=1963 RepID=UPI001F225494|nr:hypothetical protein [Streptomyces olivochromogenes]MCF3130440.1 hypothetical protein [Streptomyces olivochromogenes]